MSNNVLPNLSEWFEVPVGATIPANTPHYLEMPSGEGYLSLKGKSYDRSPEDRSDGTYYTEHKIEAPKQTLEDVIREGINDGLSTRQIARSVEAFHAEQPKQPKVIIDAGNDEWRLNDDGRYDLWFYDGIANERLQGFTRELIDNMYGIKEERY